MPTPKENNLARQARYRQKHRPQRLDYNKKYRDRIRAAVIALLGGRCSRCGFSDARALQIDHIHGGGRIECRNLGSDGIQRKILKMQNPFEEYQLLCANCNWIKRYENGEHNTWIEADVAR